VSVGAECPKCGHDHAEVHLTAMCSDLDVPIHDGLLLVDRAILTEADTFAVSAVCLNCGYVRDVHATEWSWA
jgi:predicted nucleic-acid-binding Zn-ribbon protein